MLTLRRTREIKSHPIFHQLPLDSIQHSQALYDIKGRKKNQNQKRPAPTKFEVFLLIPGYFHSGFLIPAHTVSKPAGLLLGYDRTVALPDAVIPTQTAYESKTQKSLLPQLMPCRLAQNTNARQTPELRGDRAW